MGGSPNCAGSWMRRPIVDGFEVIAVLVFFLIGYWLVDFFWPKKKNADPAQDRDPPGPEKKT